jgi:predicted DNA binding CopG/RHH family protein
LKKRIRYTNEAAGSARIVKDFLPPPSQLIPREDSVRVTISLSKSSVDYFKTVAKENRTQYQKLIQKVLDLYAAHFTSR